MVLIKRCKDCEEEGVTTKRIAKFPGPRCATHHRNRKRKNRTYSHSRHVEDTYSITYDEYWQIYQAQGGRCYICRRATGERRKLAVDHDHACCDGPTSCGKCVRGLLCRTCNKYVLGHLRDDTETLARAIEYLNNPPAKAVIFRA